MHGATRAEIRLLGTGTETWWQIIREQEEVGNDQRRKSRA